MKTIAVFEAKSHRSKILCSVQLGQEFTVTKRGAPIAKIIPYSLVEDPALTKLARQTLISQCLLARAAAPVFDFDARAAIEEGRS